jgi:hypothetical protein
MKRRRTIIQNEKIIHESENLIISNCGKFTIFEIKQHTTFDLLEAVVLMMRNSIDDKVFNLPIDLFDININPEKSLYWLSGGDSDWVTNETYIDSWHNLYHEFCSEWCNTLHEIVKQSRTLGQLKDALLERLNFMCIYNWCISKGFVK